MTDTCHSPRQKDNVVAIVQARMGSTRLPGKTLVDISGKPLLEHIAERVAQSRLIDEIVVATTTHPSDDPVATLCGRLCIAVFRGSELDVLDRFYRCAGAHGARLIVRVTADDPFKDPEVLDLVISEMLTGDYDYVSNTLHPTFPEGLDVEVFSAQALERSWREATSAMDREHVTPYMWLHPDLFRLKSVEQVENLSHLRWTLDTPEDLELARAVYARLYSTGKPFLMRDILDLLDREPELLQLNADLERFAGHKKIMSGEG